MGTLSTCSLALAFMVASPPIFVDAKVDIIFSAGETPIGVYYIGDEKLAQDGNVAKQSADYEKYLGSAPANGDIGQLATFNSAFVVRSSDFKWRAKIVVWQNTDNDKAGYPYLLTFKNIMLDDGTEHAANSQMELKHSTGGYVWIPPNEAVTHKTDVIHTFELRDESKKLRFKVFLKKAENEL